MYWVRFICILIIGNLWRNFKHFHLWKYLDLFCVWVTLSILINFADSSPLWREHIQSKGHVQFEDCWVCSEEEIESSSKGYFQGLHKRFENKKETAMLCHYSRLLEKIHILNKKETHWISSRNVTSECWRINSIKRVSAFQLLIVGIFDELFAAKNSVRQANQTEQQKENWNFYSLLQCRSGRAGIVFQLFVSNASRKKGIFPCLPS